MSILSVAPNTVIYEIDYGVKTPVKIKTTPVLTEQGYIIFTAINFLNKTVQYKYHVNFSFQPTFVFE